MPIYAYKCASCGFAKDTLQKISDPPLTVCPQCGAPAFHKQVTAAGFQLKGSGWYVTDFRDGSSKPAEKSADKAGDKPAETAKSDTAATPETAKTESKPAESTVPAKTAVAPASGGGSSNGG